MMDDLEWFRLLAWIGFAIWALLTITFTQLYSRATFRALTRGNPIPLITGLAVIQIANVIECGITLYAVYHLDFGREWLYGQLLLPILRGVMHGYTGITAYMQSRENRDK